MNEKQGKLLFAAYICTLITGLQVVAWISGFDGTVFAFTSLIIGAIVGSVLGFSFKAIAGK